MNVHDLKKLYPENSKNKIIIREKKTMKNTTMRDRKEQQLTKTIIVYVTDREHQNLTSAVWMDDNCKNMKEKIRKIIQAYLRSENHVEE